MRLTFQPTLPLRGATSSSVPSTTSSSFNPRSPCGERQRVGDGKYRLWWFQPTLPLRGATPRLKRWRYSFGCFNPRSPCGERPPSIRSTRSRRCFNPRSPCGERRLPMDDFERASAFQPTLPLRGATLSRPGRRPSTSRFNPRSPCGERHSLPVSYTHLTLPTT